jgi:NTE family protein
MPPGHAGEPRFSSSARYGPAIGAGAGTAGSPGPRVGLVLGAGGVAGSAFHAGVLAAIEEVTGWDPRRATVIVGTSAGSITATSLRAGLSAADLLARAEDRPMSAAGIRLMARVGPPRTPPPLRSGGLPRRPADIAARLARAAVRPLEARPLALVAGLLPEGTIGTDLIAAGIAGLALGSWPGQPLWVCAVRARDGRLVVFGRDSRPTLPEAVAASCAIPGFFRPVSIDGDSYLDGGAHSPTNADVLADVDLDLVLVSSPMSLVGPGLRLAMDQPVRRWSRLVLEAEAQRLRRRGKHVLAFQPTAADAAVIGPNPMDPERRAAIARQARESTLHRLARADTRGRLKAIWT